MLYVYTLNTDRQGYYDITSQVKDSINKAGVKDGICIVFCPHTTGAITINENADPDVTRDLRLGMDKVFPNMKEFRHMEGNSDAHLKSSNVGVSETLIIDSGHLILGTWQGIYFCEFDGPRTRRYYVKVINS